MTSTTRPGSLRKRTTRWASSSASETTSFRRRPPWEESCWGVRRRRAHRAPPTAWPVGRVATNYELGICQLEVNFFGAAAHFQSAGTDESSVQSTAFVPVVRVGSAGKSVRWAAHSDLRQPRGRLAKHGTLPLLSSRERLRLDRPQARLFGRRAQAAARMRHSRRDARQGGSSVARRLHGRLHHVPREVERALAPPARSGGEEEAAAASMSSLPRREAGHVSLLSVQRGACARGAVCRRPLGQRRPRATGPIAAAIAACLHPPPHRAELRRRLPRRIWERDRVARRVVRVVLDANDARAEFGEKEGAENPQVGGPWVDAHVRDVAAHAVSSEQLDDGLGRDERRVQDRPRRLGHRRTRPAVQEHARPVALVAKHDVFPSAPK